MATTTVLKTQSWNVNLIATVSLFTIGAVIKQELLNFVVGMQKKYEAQKATVSTLVVYPVISLNRSYWS